jgi:predicted nucleic acid-binding protein
MRFVDTNVLLYAASTAPDELHKKKKALEILDGDDVVVSVQVLQEFYVQATRASRSDRLEHEIAVALVESWLRFRVEETTVHVLQNALSTAARWDISYGDAAIVEAARAAACPILLSEDLQNGMDFAGVRVENPFV